MKRNKGFTLLIAIVVTSIMLMVSFVVANVALKEIVLAAAGTETQYAFYAADSGTDCALYWDLKDSSVSAFATATASTIWCNGQSISTGSQTNIATNPVSSSVIGGGGNGNATSTFQLNFSHGCAIVKVGKQNNGITNIDSRGYNTCNTASPHRYERGITLTYQGNTTAFGGGGAVGSTIGFRSASSFALNSAGASDVTEGGTVTATGSACGASETSDKAFDNLMTSGSFSKWCDIEAPNGGTVPYVAIMYDFAGATAYNITSYTITSGNDAPGRDPKDWKLQGCQGTCPVTGGTGGWVDLDTQTNQTFASRYQTNTYNFTNGTAYQQYRLRVTANNGDTTYTQITELQLFPSINSMTITAPSGVAQNDTMIAAISIRPHTTIVTPPSGWTLIRRIDNVTPNATSLLTYRKTAGSSEPASYTWGYDTFTSSAGVVAAFAGANTTNPVDVENAQNTTTLNVDAPSVTSTTANTMVVTIHETSNASVWTSPVGMSQATQISSPAAVSPVSIQVNYVSQAAAGATGVKSATQDVGQVQDAGNGQTVVLKQ